ncbi:MAG: hypothetical protein ACTSQJ_02200 [Promethearchaeota archaeon]
MSIDKWISNDKSIKKEENEKSKILTINKIKELKKEKIKRLINKSPDNRKNNYSQKEQIHKKDDFLSYLIEFKDWLDQRTYLKGDIDKLEIWIKNLYKKLENEKVQYTQSKNEKGNIELIEKFKQIPPNFLEEKMRIAISKKLRGVKKTNSDLYYLRKLKEITKDKLKEARFYEIIKQILE